MDRMPLNAHTTSTLDATAIPANALLSLLGGRVRLAILRMLAKGPSHVSGIAAEVEASIGLVSHNLRHLRNAGLVTRVTKARERIYSLAQPCQLGANGDLSLHLRTAEGGHVSVHLPAKTDLAVQTNDEPVGRMFHLGPETTLPCNSKTASPQSLRVRNTA